MKRRSKPVRLIPVRDVKAMCDKWGFTHVIVFGQCDGPAESRQYVATYGTGLQCSAQACALGDELKRLLYWPDRQCHTTSRGVLALQRANKRLRAKLRLLTRAPIEPAP